MQPENYQRKMIEDHTKVKCYKTNIRINIRENTLHEIGHPNKTKNGFDYSERL
jgi:hypothetical protein